MATGLKVGLRLEPQDDSAFRIDPEKMQPRATAPAPAAARGLPSFYTPGPERSRSIELDVHADRLPPPIGVTERDLILRHCRLLNSVEAVALYEAFVSALEESRAEQRRHPAKPVLVSGWWREPWYDLSPAAFTGATSKRPAPHAWPKVLDHARRLGFHNVALLRDLDLIAPLTRSFDALMAEADHLELRIAAGLDASHVALFDPRLSLASGLHTPAGLRRLLVALGVEVTHGVRAARAHRVDRWISAPTGPSAASPVHALLALMKLYLRLLDPEDALFPELVHPPRNVERFVGDGIAIEGRATAAEGDLLHWHEGTLALRQALVGRNATIFEAELAVRPQLMHGAALSLALEDHDVPAHPLLASSLIEAVGDDRARVELALAILYAAPITPVVHAGLEVGAHPGTLTAEWLERADLAQGRGVSLLERLNRLRATDALSHAALEIIDTGVPSTMAWIRGSTDRVLFVGNLGAEVASITVPAGLRPLLVAESLSGRAGIRVEAVAGGSRLELGPSAFGYFEWAANR